MKKKIIIIIFIITGIRINLRTHTQLQNTQIFEYCPLQEGRKNTKIRASIENWKTSFSHPQDFLWFQEAEKEPFNAENPRIKVTLHQLVNRASFMEAKVNSLLP